MVENVLKPVDPLLFRLLRDGAISEFSRLTLGDEGAPSLVRPFLPSLVRMALCPPASESPEWMHSQKEILCILSGVEVVNSIVGFLQVDFAQLNSDIQRCRDEERKALSVSRGSGVQMGVFVASKSTKLAMDFENAETESDSSTQNKMRLVLNEIARASLQTVPTSFSSYSCELFENEGFLNEVADIVCLTAAELPDLFDFESLISALLRLKAGPSIITYLVANMPEKFTKVASILLSSSQSLDEFSSEAQVRMKSLRLLADLCPSFCLSIRENALALRSLPSLIILLTLDHHHGNHQTSHDVVLFFSGLLFDHDSPSRDWFVQYVQACRRRAKKKMKHQQPDGGTSFEKLMQFLETAVKEWLSKNGNANVSMDDVHSGCSLLRIFCALIGLTGPHLGSEFAEDLTGLLTWHPPVGTSALQFVELGICLLMVCPFLASEPSRKTCVVDWLKWLVKRQSDFKWTVAEETLYTKLLMLIGIHFHNGHFESIVQSVESVLNMKGIVRTGGLMGLKIMFTQDVFPNEILTCQAVSVPVTPSLNADVTGVLPAHCLNLLLKSSAFTKHGLSVKGWILEQVRNSGSPVHPVMPQLINQFVMRVVETLKQPDSPRCVDGFSESETTSFFKTQTNLPADVTPQLLILQYVLALENAIQPNTNSSAGKLLLDPALLVNVIPVKQLLLLARQHIELYGELYPSLVSLVRTQLPHLCLVDDWLAAEECGLISSLPQRRPKSFWIKETKIKQNGSGSALLRLSQLPPVKLVPHMPYIVRCLPRLLNPGTPRYVQDLVCQLWFALNTVTPRKLWLKTVIAFLPPSFCSSNASMSHSTAPDSFLTLDPLIIFRCDENAFRCPPLLEIFLHVLQGYLDASERHLSSFSQRQTAAELGSAESERAELADTLIRTQRSAVVQLLLELCLPLSHEEEDISSLQLSNLREIHCLICCFLHQLFIADAKLAKLVQFQGYPLELLPTVVSGIPSMHICLDYLPELLSQTQLDKKLFAVYLASQLCVYYPLPKSLGVAQQCISHMSLLAVTLSTGQCSEFFQSAVPALVSMYRAFPALSHEIIGLLLQLACSLLSWSLQRTAASAPALTVDPYGRINKVAFLDKRRPRCTRRRSVRDILGMIRNVLAEMGNFSYA
eukprot:m.282243 g.282243  ORF g.282243 m.282243 type:complete len:1133 (+) comp40652_c1_seq25:1776-5174(+)